MLTNECVAPLQVCASIKYLGLVIEAPVNDNLGSSFEAHGAKTEFLQVKTPRFYLVSG